MRGYMTDTPFVHVDDFINSPYSLKGGDVDDLSERYAKYWLDHARRSAAFHSVARPFFVQKLFCTFRGERHRVTGASRMGDIWLTKDFDQSRGYQKRVNLAECSLWWWTEKEPTQSMIETAERFVIKEHPLNLPPKDVASCVAYMETETDDVHELRRRLHASLDRGSVLAGALQEVLTVVEAARVVLRDTFAIPGVKDGMSEDVKGVVVAADDDIREACKEAQSMLNFATGVRS